METKKIKGKATFPIEMEVEFSDFQPRDRKEVSFNKRQNFIEIEGLENLKRPRVDVWIKTEGVESLQTMPVSLNKTTNKITVLNTEGLSGTIVIS